MGFLPWQTFFQPLPKKWFLVEKIQQLESWVKTIFSFSIVCLLKEESTFNLSDGS